MPASWVLWVAIGCGVLGVCVFIFALGLGKYQLDNSKDKSADALNTITEKIEKLDKLEEIVELLKAIIKEDKDADKK